MNNELVLHHTQEKALNFLVDAIENKKDIVALVGAAGTGKSEILSRLLLLTDREITVSATTNKAASRLSKDIPGACTVHSATAIPVFKANYIDIENFINDLNREPEDKKDEFIKKYAFILSAKEFIKKWNIEPEKFNSMQDLIHSIGINAFDPEIFSMYKLHDYIPGSVIIIDEASMLPEKSWYNEGSLITIGLDSVKKVFSQVILVGDDSQLPPINSSSSFEGIEKVELTKNYRSEKDLLRAIQWARDGKSFYDWENREDENVKVVSGISNRWYTGAFGRSDISFLTYRNATRHEINKKVRGNRGKFPEDGEVFFWRGKSDENTTKGEIGTFKADTHSVEFENSGYYVYDYTYIDGYDDGYARIAYAYAGTTHSFQGSSNKHIILFIDDIPSFIDADTKRRFIYTGVSRAEESLTIII